MTGDVVLITAATEEVLTLAEARSQCEVDHNVNDYDLVGWLQEGREDFEHETDRAVLTSTWEYTLTQWPKCGGDIRLPKGRLQSVTSVTWYDTADQAHVLSTSDYFVSRGSELGQGMVGLAYGKSWPMEIMRPNDSIVIRFVAGWASRDAVPEQIKSYVRLFVGHRYQHREAVLSGAAGAQESKELAVGLKRISDRMRMYY